MRLLHCDTFIPVYNKRLVCEWRHNMQLSGSEVGRLAPARGSKPMYYRFQLTQLEVFLDHASKQFFDKSSYLAL